MRNPAYGILMVAGIAVAAALWQRRARTQTIPVMVFVGGLIGAVLGAKIGYFVAELPFRPRDADWYLNILVGRTILGGLLGGYLGVEWGKHDSGYARPTGDSFALVVPVGLALGRVGCHLHGCCPGLSCSPAWYAVMDAGGVARYPVALVEIIFHLSFALLAWGLHRGGVLRGQLFHVYLMAYGVFRFMHEFFRDTPRPVGWISTYQVLALVLVVFGAVRYLQRARTRHASDGSPARDAA